jgi:hypothetical protein
MFAENKAMEQRVNKDGFWKVLSVVLLLVLAGVVAYTIWQGQQPRHVYYEHGGAQPHSQLAALSPSLELDHGSIYWMADLAEQPAVRYPRGDHLQTGRRRALSFHEDAAQHAQFFPPLDNAVECRIPEDQQPVAGGCFREDGCVDECARG